MTSQSTEYLLFDGRVESLRTLPLDDYLDPRGIDLREAIPRSSTSLARRYQGFWEIHGNRLYLVGLFDGSHAPIDPSIIFGDRRLPIEADWYSGRLNLDRGALLFWHHMGWASEYSARLFLYLAGGRLLRRRLCDRRKVFERRYGEVADYLNDHRRRELAGESLPPPMIAGFTRAGFDALGISPSTYGLEAMLDEDEDEDDDSMPDVWLENFLPRLQRPG